jgi:hypothetical protein
MDPTATLRDAGLALDAGDPPEVLALLEGYWNWRRQGGFEPEGGDVWARHLAKQARQMWQGCRQHEPQPLRESIDAILKNLRKEGDS